MVFKCQENSFLKEYISTVVSCNENELITCIDGKENVIKGYDVIVEDTILFPEGGGQPSDRGFLNDLKVYHVRRDGADAIHFVDKALAVGGSVAQKIDWERRFDHMQQHSGQHLITAVIDREFGFSTLSWYLGEQVAYIELDTSSFTPNQIETAENIINELIKANKKVSVQNFKSAEELNNVRARGLPDDHVGDIRVVTIEDVESNMCCGTHVSSLCQLQAVKFLHVEKSKRKDKILLYFLVGNRILKRLATCLQREQQLTTILKNNPSEHPNLVEKLQKSAKILTKDLQNVMKDIAIFEVEKLKRLNPLPKYYVLHRKEAEPDFMNNFIREIGTIDCLLFLSIGDDKTTGSVTLYGNEKAVCTLADKILELLDGKGMVRGKKLQAKVNNMKNRSKVIELLNEYFF